MSQSIIIIAPSHWQLDVIERRLSERWTTRHFENEGNHEIQIRAPDYGWYLRVHDYGRDPKLVAEYLMNKAVDNAHKDIIKNAVFFSLEFDDLGICKQVLEHLIRSDDIIIDTTYGEFLSGLELKRRISEGADYDWRKLS